MPEVVSDEVFLVHEQGNSIWNGHTVKRRLWFEVIEGADTGTRVSIPLVHSSYDEATSRRLRGLSEGDFVVASLYRDGPPDGWRVSSPPTLKH